jgi:hypothetical protein
MSPHSFALTLVLGSALLAFWVGGRFPNVGPTTLGYAALHAMAGFAAIRAVPGLTEVAMGWPSKAMPFLVSFGIFLPLMTYTFLTGLWVIRFIQRTVSGNIP